MFVDTNIILLSDLLYFLVVLKAFSDITFLLSFQIAMKEHREQKIPFTICQLVFNCRLHCYIEPKFLIHRTK